MKKNIILILAIMMLPAIGNAQLGGLLEKAAKKAVNKTAEKLADKAADRASEAAAKAIEGEVDKRLPKEQKKPATAASTAQVTYESLMRQLPELPSADQLVKYKEAELNEKTLKLIASKVTLFNTKVLDLAAQCSALSYADIDSAQVMDMAAAYTGLTTEELEVLSKMSDEEQQAWLQIHYSQQRAQTAAINQAIDASGWLEPLQPIIDRWTTAGQHADDAYTELDNKLRPIYKKYASRLATATGSERTNLLVAYYTEAVPHIRVAVQKAINIRIAEQLPIAEEIEAEMVKIRAAHKDAINQLLNYPALTATQYFSEVAHLLDIPQYTE